MTKTKAIDIIGAPSTFGQRKLGSPPNVVGI
ncbi:arginase [Staphylococcus aureus]|nr:arginase [Staphylococcus aureus]